MAIKPISHRGRIIMSEGHGHDFENKNVGMVGTILGGVIFLIGLAGVFLTLAT